MYQDVGRERHVVEIGQQFPCFRGLASGKQGGWGGGGVVGGEGGAGHPRPSLTTSSREERASECYSRLWVGWVGRGKGGRETDRSLPALFYVLETPWCTPPLGAGRRQILSVTMVVA